jgi:hypothetical protein
MTARHPRLENLLGVSLMRAAYGVENPRVAIHRQSPHHNPQARQQLYLQALCHAWNRAAEEVRDYLEYRRNEANLEMALDRISVDEIASPRK